jgi:Na+-driven multidrug efflux pump
VEVPWGQGITRKRRPERTIFGGGANAQQTEAAAEDGLKRTKRRALPGSGCHREGKRAFEKPILRVGALASVSPLQTVATVLILTWLVAEFGLAALAGYGIGSRLEFLLVPIGFAIGVASVPLVGMAIGAGMVARAKRVAWTAAALAAVVLGALGVVLALAPDLWTRLFTDEPAVVASSALYFQWVGPFYGLFGFGLSLYFSALGAGKVGGPVLAGTLRLLVVAVGGALLARADAEPWTIFALVALGMAVFGLAAGVTVWRTSWGEEREHVPRSGTATA